MNTETDSQNPKSSPVRKPEFHRLDPDRDSRAFPTQWDLTSLPEPTHMAGELPQEDGEPGAQPASAMSAEWAEFFADLQLDPFLDDTDSVSKRDCSIF